MDLEELGGLRALDFVADCKAQDAFALVARSSGRPFIAYWLTARGSIVVRWFDEPTDADRVKEERVRVRMLLLAIRQDIQSPDYLGVARWLRRADGLNWWLEKPPAA